MGSFVTNVLSSPRISRIRELFSANKIPGSDHLARICFKKPIQSGEITPQAFAPRRNETYLSAHWLEYFQPMDTIALSLDRLRDFLSQSAHGELTLKKSDLLAVLKVEELRSPKEGARFTRLFCRHLPRGESCASRGGLLDYSDPNFDSHSGIYTIPWKGAELLAIQQFLLSKVLHSEPAVHHQMGAATPSKSKKH